MMEMEIDLENAETNAQILFRCAEDIGVIARDLGRMERIGWDSVLSESESSEFIQLKAPDLCRALKLIAMRLDRSALEKFSDG